MKQGLSVRIIPSVFVWYLWNASSVVAVSSTGNIIRDTVNNKSKEPRYQHGKSYTNNFGQDDQVTRTEPKVYRRVPDEQRLMKYLFQGYEKTVRPVRNASTAVVIRMGLTMTQIFDMDEKDQILVSNVWLDQEWDDEFMRWIPEDFANITVLRVPCHKLWLPDIVLYNNAAEYTDGVMPANAMVRYDGNIFWPVPTKLQSSCKVDVTYFPFDEQTCFMKFGSWTYDGFQVDITNRTMEVDLSNYVNNGEWELISIKIIRNEVKYACCNEPFPDVTFKIIIRRRTLYYMMNMVFPCIMMSSLTLLVFCLPPDSGEKIALGITVLLAYSVFMLAVAENLPETSEFVPVISIYLTIVMALTSMSVIMTVFVLNLHHRGPNKSTVPVWLKELLVNKLAPILCVTQTIPYPGYQYDNEETFIQNVSLNITLDNIQQALQNELQFDRSYSDSSEKIQNKHNQPKSVLVARGPINTEEIIESRAFDHAKCSTCIAKNAACVIDNVNLEDVQTSTQIQQKDLIKSQALQYSTCTPSDLQIHQTGHKLQNQQTGAKTVLHKDSSPSYSKEECQENNQNTKRKIRPGINKTNEEILQSLKRILQKQDRDNRDYELIQDWRRVAQCVDRILFFVFLAATVFSTVGLLVIAPATQSYSDGS